MRLAAFATASLVAALVFVATPTAAKLTTPEREALTAYLSALEHGNFSSAFARLSDDERRYFRSPRNLAAVFAADRLKLVRFTLLESMGAGAAGTIAVVSERVAFFDHAHQRMGSITANVRYGIVPNGHGPAIKDPFHPWFAFDPPDAIASVNGVRATVRKVSFYSGRVEILVTFANTSDQTVTILPYGRSVLRDDIGKVHAPVTTRLPGLTNTTLFEGLRLPPSARYTGAMTFFSADRFMPKRLSLAFAPALVDGADAPFEFKLPDISVPAAS